MPLKKASSSSPNRKQLPINPHLHMGACVPFSYLWQNIDCLDFVQVTELSFVHKNKNPVMYRIYLFSASSPPPPTLALIIFLSRLLRNSVSFARRNYINVNLELTALQWTILGIFLNFYFFSYFPRSFSKLFYSSYCNTTRIHIYVCIYISINIYLYMYVCCRLFVYVYNMYIW